MITTLDDLFIHGDLSTVSGHDGLCHREHFLILLAGRETVKETCCLLALLVGSQKPLAGHCGKQGNGLDGPLV